MHGIDVQVANVDHYYGACMQLGECPTLAIYSYRPLTYVILSINLAYKPLQSSAIYIYIYIYIHIYSSWSNPLCPARLSSLWNAGGPLWSTWAQLPE